MCVGEICTYLYLCLVTRMQDKIVIKEQLIIVQTCGKGAVIKTVKNQNYFHEKFKNRLSLEVSIISKASVIPKNINIYLGIY